jgi:hypothetical protein
MLVHIQNGFLVADPKYKWNNKPPKAGHIGQQLTKMGGHQQLAVLTHTHSIFNYFHYHRDLDKQAYQTVTDKKTSRHYGNCGSKDHLI